MSLHCDSVSLFRANKQLVHQVSIRVNAGELIGLIGPNGAGKSSLMSLCAALIKPDAGQIFLHDKLLSEWTANERARQLAWVAQSAPINWPLTVERIISLGRLPHLGSWHQPSAADQQAIDNAIEATDCGMLRTQTATTLSGGERTRMLLARALATEPTVLLADEPVAALDLGHQLQTMDVLREFANGDKSCLVVLHDLSLAARYCDRLYLMRDAAIIAEGTPADVLVEDNIRLAYDVRVASGATPVPWYVPYERIIR